MSGVCAARAALTTPSVYCIALSALIEPRYLGLWLAKLCAWTIMIVRCLLAGLFAFAILVKIRGVLNEVS